MSVYWRSQKASNRKGCARFVPSRLAVSNGSNPATTIPLVVLPCVCRECDFLTLLLLGRQGPPTLAAMHWWTTRGSLATSGREKEVAGRFALHPHRGQRGVPISGAKGCQAEFVGTACAAAGAV